MWEIRLDYVCKTVFKKHTRKLIKLAWKHIIKLTRPKLLLYKVGEENSRNDILYTEIKQLIANSSYKNYSRQYGN